MYFLTIVELGGPNSVYSQAHPPVLGREGEDTPYDILQLAPGSTSDDPWLRTIYTAQAMPLSSQGRISCLCGISSCSSIIRTVVVRFMAF